MYFAVALRKESVDRNSVPFRPASHLSVALRKESVDRNFTWTKEEIVNKVALRKESVDRNAGLGATGKDGTSRSPQGERG